MPWEAWGRGHAGATIDKKIGEHFGTQVRCYSAKGVLFEHQKIDILLH